jgi:hypothetical protein
MEGVKDRGTQKKKQQKVKENENQRHSKAEERRTADHHASVIISVPALR